MVDGKVASVVLAAQDVSERKRAQAEVLAGRHMALLGTLAAGIAHEINTPVQFVRDSIDEPLKFPVGSGRYLLGEKTAGHAGQKGQSPFEEGIGAVNDVRRARHRRRLGGD